MSLRDTLYGQFKQPTGVLGRAVGHLMALKNGRRGRWVVERLAIEAGMRVLEVGCGPGADGALVVARLGASGSYAGVDASDVMVRQATRRNRSAVRNGRAAFLVRDLADGLPWASNAFDLAFSVNCAQFWPDLPAGLQELGRVVRPDCRLVVAVQPMQSGATEDDSARWAERLAAAGRQGDLEVLDVARGATSPSTALVHFRVR